MHNANTLSLDRFIDNIEPNANGSWDWPFQYMEPGDWFTVKHSHRPSRDVQRMAHVRGHQLGKKFSVNRNHLPGYTSVLCVERPRAPMPGDVIDVISGTALAEHIEEYTDANVNWMWGANELPADQVYRKPVTYRKPMAGQRTFVVVLTQGTAPAYVRFDFEDESVRIERLAGKMTASEIINQAKVEELMA